MILVVSKLYKSLFRSLDIYILRNKDYSAFELWTSNFEADKIAELQDLAVRILLFSVFTNTTHLIAVKSFCNAVQYNFILKIDRAFT